jgi:hypothetical protein
MRQRGARQAGLGFGVATGGDEPRRRGGGRDTGELLWQRTGAVARGQGANRRGLERWLRRGQTRGRGEQEVAGGGQIQGTVSAAGRPETEQGSRGARKKKGGGMKLRTDLEFERKAGT